MSTQEPADTLDPLEHAIETIAHARLVGADRREKPLDRLMSIEAKLRPLQHFLLGVRRARRRAAEAMKRSA